MSTSMNIHPEVIEALEEGLPVVALESTIISHGLPSPHNLATARGCEAAVRSAGAVPATVAVIEGKLHIGLDDTQLGQLSVGEGIAKLSRRELPLALATGLTGTTTVAATMLAADQARIKVFATGGIGGVHYGAEETMDISPDLTALATSDIIVVCSGAKCILDMRRTREVLETLSVPILGNGVDHLPGFWYQQTDIPVDLRVDDLNLVKEIVAWRKRLNLNEGILFCNPVPAEHGLGSDEVSQWIDDALQQADRESLRGKELTPFLLDAVAQLSKGKSMAANIALIKDNARVAGELAKTLV